MQPLPPLVRRQTLADVLHRSAVHHPCKLAVELHPNRPAIP